jgi:hypothetical protein
MGHVDLWEALRNSRIPHPARDGIPRGLAQLRNRAFRASLFAATRPACRRSGPSAAATTVFRHSGTARTSSYDVNVPFMQLQRHGWDIHIVSAEPDRDGDQDHWPQKSQKTQQHQRTRSGRPNARPRRANAPQEARTDPGSPDAAQGGRTDQEARTRRRKAERTREARTRPREGERTGKPERAPGSRNRRPEAERAPGKPNGPGKTPGPFG